MTLGFLLVWPTKWPQYVLTLLTPLAWMAAEGFRAVIWLPLTDWLRQAWENRGVKRERIQATAPAIRKSDPCHPLAGARDHRPVIDRHFSDDLPAGHVADRFPGSSIRDGLQGGVFREVFRGLTGQVEPFSLATSGMDSPPPNRCILSGWAI